jgi:hypothetical protein
MARPSASLIVRVLGAVAVGLLEPYVEVAWKCRAGFESSEACVWGRAYLPLGRVAGLVIVAPLAVAVLVDVVIVFTAATSLWSWRRRDQGRAA